MITVSTTLKFKRGNENKVVHPQFLGETLDAISHDMNEYVSVQEERGWELSDNCIDHIEVKGGNRDSCDDLDTDSLFWGV